MPYTIPFYAYTTSRFGETAGRTNPHRGHDVAPGGQDFPAWVDGVVVTAGWQSCLGNRVVIKNSADGYFIGVSHLANLKVGVGATVYRATAFRSATALGNIGATGECQNGRHAHITVSKDSRFPESGSVIDPVSYANNAGEPGTGGGGAGYGLTSACQLSLQRAMSHVGRYAGPHDGDFGPVCVTAMQQWLKDLGYLAGDYATDGVPGPTYGAALQELARDKGGYIGAIDGAPGGKTSEALIYWAEEVVIKNGGGTGTSYAYGLTMAAQRACQGALTKLNLYDGPIDGVFGPRTVAAMQTYLKGRGFLPADYGIDGNPGPLYGAALQKLATEHGYTGAIDGVPGDMTSAAIERWAASIGTVVLPPIQPPTNKWPTTGAFFIDVASPQRDIDFGKAKAGGAKAAIIKMGGLNVLPQYTAPYYVAMVDRAHAAGLMVGHYYLIGLGQTPEEQAAYFVSNLHGFDVTKDVLALDNEKLDGNGTKWGDAAAARFVREVIRLTGIDKKRVWHYAGGADYRELAPWPELESTGARYWWAAYGSNSGTLEEAPDLRGSIPRYDVHQFSSTVDIAGYRLDGNWSPHTVEVLWATGTVVDPEEPPVEPEPDPLADFINLIGPDVATLRAAVDRLTAALDSV